MLNYPLYTSQYLFDSMLDQEELQAFHVVFTTHNSRVSNRMKRFYISPGLPIELGLEEEIELTKIIRDIVFEYELKVLAYNICKDHVHIIIVCPSSKLSWIVARLKGKSSMLFNRFVLQSKNVKNSLNYYPSKKHYRRFWSQKYYQANLDVWRIATKQIRPGYYYRNTHLSNAINYIMHNRIKHQLPQSEELESIIKEFTCDINVGFGLMA